MLRSKVLASSGWSRLYQRLLHPLSGEAILKLTTFSWKLFLNLQLFSWTLVLNLQISSLGEFGNWYTIQFHGQPAILSSFVMAKIKIDSLDVRPRRIYDGAMKFTMALGVSHLQHQAPDASFMTLCILLEFYSLHFTAIV